MTNHEKEKQPAKEEKEEKKGKAPTTFLEILRRLQELAKKIALSVQEETEQKTLSKRQGELIAEFRGTNFGQQTEVKRQGIGGNLEGILNELEEARKVSDEEFRKKRQAANEAREKASKEAQKHWEKEEQAGVQEEHKGIAKHLLEEVTGRAEERQKAIIEEREKEGKGRVRQRERPHRRDTGPARRDKEREIAFFDDLLANRVIDENTHKQAVEAIRAGRKVELKNVGGIEGNDIEFDPPRLGEPPYTRRFLTNEQRDKIRGNRKGRDEVFNNIFRSADRRPDAPFEQSFSMYSDAPALDEFFDIVQEIKDIGSKELQRYIALTQLRRLSHNANYFVTKRNRDIEGLVNYMSQFDSTLADFLFKGERIEGLTEVSYHFLEQALEKIKADNEGTMPPEHFVVQEGEEMSEWDEKAKGWLDEYARRGFLKDENGERVTKLDDWEAEAALRMAKGWGIFTKRLLEIVASARKPTEIPSFGKFREKLPPKGERMSHRPMSYWGEGLLRVLNPHEQLIESFNIGHRIMAVLLYRTDRRPHIWSYKELEKAAAASALGRLTGETFIDLINIFKIGGAFSQSTWRADVITSLIEGEKRRNIGYGMRLLLAEDEARVEALESLRERANQAPKEEIDRLTENIKNGKVLKIWQEIAQNNPLKIARILDDEWAAKRETVMRPTERRLREILKDVSDNREKDTLERLKTERDEIERNLILVQEERVQRRGETLNFDVIEDVEQRRKVEAYVEAIQQECTRNNEELLKRLAEKKFPFNVGTEDATFRDYDFVRVGAQGLIARRFSDFQSASLAMKELSDLLEHLGDYRNPQEVILQLIKIRSHIDDYSPKAAREYIPQLAEGIMRFYDKEWWSKFPIVGPILGQVGGRLPKGFGRAPCYAQHLFGMGAMSLDESDKNNFINLLRLNNLVTEEDADKLKTKVGAKPWFIAYDYLRTVIPLGLLLLAYSFLQLFASETEEEAKTF